jgi:hypothetical protein
VDSVRDDQDVGLRAMGRGSGGALLPALIGHMGRGGRFVALATEPAGVSARRRMNPSVRDVHIRRATVADVPKMAESRSGDPPSTSRRRQRPAAGARAAVAAALAVVARYLHGSRTTRVTRIDLFHPSLPAPLCTEKRSPGSYFCLSSASRTRHLEQLCHRSVEFARSQRSAPSADPAFLPLALSLHIYVFVPLESRVTGRPNLP